MASQSQTADKIAQAKVQWWNRSSVYVRCPNCEEIHYHSFFDYVKQSRRSDCIRVGSCDYEVRFPSTDDVGYEIDKQRALS